MASFFGDVVLRLFVTAVISVIALLGWKIVHRPLRAVLPDYFQNKLDDKMTLRQSITISAIYMLLITIVDYIKKALPFARTPIVGAILVIVALIVVIGIAWHYVGERDQYDEYWPDLSELEVLIYTGLLWCIVTALNFGVYLILHAAGIR